MWTVVCKDLHYAIGPINSEVVALKLALELTRKGACEYGVVETVAYAEDADKPKRGYL